ncbi:unnamed protein product [Brassicogethes aeneus]|uniref:Carboxylic ester hydrolase n=1 Tax=Brassicogethes aeneus TaxID=1431903 RepID=A0A9P0ATB8_BRAAE|nr:unnamed protein product [Brassicogethes aeneus]
MKFILLVLFILVISDLKGMVSYEMDPEVTLEDGKILGKIGTTNLKRPYHAFEGIPFAKPPVRNLRFEPPEPNEKWDETLIAKTRQSNCIEGSGDGSEDCLYLNVYTPNITGKNMSVMIWIHGGIFIYKDSSVAQFNPEYLLDEDVILVDINYRLGIFGFLSTGDMASPGNNGIKDLIMALKWVQKNIVHFGGNPDKITLFGQSAGSASVSYLVQSKLASGLFHRAIMQSGTSLCLWSLAREARKIAFNIGTILDIVTQNSSKLVEELKKVDSSVLHSKTKFVYSVYLAGVDVRNGLPIGPVVEPDHEGAVFTGKSHEMLSQGVFNRVPLIIGHNSQEALEASALPGIIKLLIGKFTLYKGNFAPIDMNINDSVKAIDVGLQIRYHYFKYKLVVGDKKDLSQFISDDQFNRPITETVRLQSQYVPVYYYVFSYQSKMGESFKRSLPGVGHSEELIYIFKKDDANTTSEDILTRKRVIKLWTNFAKYGNPTPEEDILFENKVWVPANSGNTKEELKYFNINETLSIAVNPNEKNLNYFKNLYNKYGNPPYDTY